MNDQEKLPAEFEEMLDKELDKLFEGAVVPVQEYGPVSGPSLHKGPLEDPFAGLTGKELIAKRANIQWLLEGLAQAHKIGDDRRARKTRNQLRKLGWYINVHGKELPNENGPVAEGPNGPDGGEDLTHAPDAGAEGGG